VSRIVTPPFSPFSPPSGADNNFLLLFLFFSGPAWGRRNRHPSSRVPPFLFFSLDAVAMPPGPAHFSLSPFFFPPLFFPQPCPIMIPCCDLPFSFPPSLLYGRCFPHLISPSFPSVAADDKPPSLLSLPFPFFFSVIRHIGE